MVLATATTEHAQSGAWIATDLGTLGGLYGEADGINEAGHVVGGSTTASGSSHAFLWTPSAGMVDLGTLGGSTSQAFGINNTGQVVGFSNTAGGASLAFLWTAASGMVSLGTLPGGFSSGAEDINDLGHVVGSSGTAGFNSHAFLWTPAGGMQDLGTLGGANSRAMAINEVGQVVGRSDTAGGDEHAFLWTAATGMVDLGTLGGTSSSASGINEAGQVVGRSETAGGAEHAFLWTMAGGMVDLGTLGDPDSRSQADAINDAGQVVGRFVPDGDDRAFIWTAAGGMVELPATTGIESGAKAINNVGLIAGYADIATGDAHAAVWSSAAAPLPPANLVVHSVVGNSVTLRWTVVPVGVTPTAFEMEGGVLPGETLATLPIGSLAPTFTFDAPSGSFYVRLHALSGAVRSAPSNEVRIHVNVPVVPSAPANLLGLVNGSSLALAWTNTYAGGPPTSLVLDVTGSLTTSIPLALSVGFAFAGVPVGTYTLALRAQNAAGPSLPSNAVTLTFPGPCMGPPQTPANVLAYRVGNTVFVDWAPGPAGPAPTGYVLNVTGAFVGSFPTNQRAMSGAVGPGSYTLAVAATNACGTSTASLPQTVVVP
jgi:probable HAF family extracellular repeat protein